MTPLYVIKQVQVVEAEIPDIETISAALFYHGINITISNVIGSDVGDRWHVVLWISDSNPECPRHTVSSMAPTLRRALIKTFDELAKQDKNTPRPVFDTSQHVFK